MRKIVMISTLSICLLLLIVPGSTSAKAQELKTEGFVISAQKITGQMMLPSITFEKTSSGEEKPMVRFHYKNADIYGMKLSKVLITDEGYVTLHMDADGPVHLEDLTVDASGFSIGGACLNANSLISSPSMENVTMKVHQMTAFNSVLNRLKLEMTRGNQGLKAPDTEKLLSDLSALPLLQAKDAVNQLMSGHLPLTCSDQPANKKPAENKNGILNSINKQLTNSNENTLLKGAKGINNVKIAQSVKDILNHESKTVESITKTVQKTTKIVTDIVPSLPQVVPETADAAQQQLHSLCNEAANTSSTFPKKLGLSLVNMSKKLKKPLDGLCEPGSTGEHQLRIFQTKLFDSVGLPEHKPNEKWNLSARDYNQMTSFLNSHSDIPLITSILDPIGSILP